MKRNTWAWIYGDECSFLWEHFDIEPSHEDDRLKIELIEYEPAETEEEEEE